MTRPRDFAPHRSFSHEIATTGGEAGREGGREGKKEGKKKGRTDGRRRRRRTTRSLTRVKPPRRLRRRRRDADGRRAYNHRSSPTAPIVRDPYTVGTAALFFSLPLSRVFISAAEVSANRPAPSCSLRQSRRNAGRVTCARRHSTQLCVAYSALSARATPHGGPPELRRCRAR